MLYQRFNVFPNIHESISNDFIFDPTERKIEAIRVELQQITHLGQGKNAVYFRTEN